MWQAQKPIASSPTEPIRGYRRTVPDILNIDRLFPELVIALGLALLIGNALAWWKHRKGEVPSGVDRAQYRPARVRFLTLVGLLMTVWGTVSVFG